MPGALSIVGLGTSIAPADLGGIDLNAGAVFFRDRFHPVARRLAKPEHLTLGDPVADTSDHVASSVDSFCEAILSAAEQGAATYYVPGNPLEADATVRRLYELAPSHGVSIAITAAPGIASLTSIIDIDDLGPGLQLIDPYDIDAVASREPFDGGHQPFSPLRPLIMSASAPAPLLWGVLGYLLDFYGEDADVLLIEDGEVSAVGLASLYYDTELDDRMNHIEAFYLPAVDAFDVPTTSDAVQQMASRLRAPNGCPWDREQSHQSLTFALIEEAYEVVDAIERNDMVDLQEELGDLLFQVHIHSQIAQEADEFRFEDVVSGIVAKLYRRHPHVFGAQAVDTAGQVVSQWDEIKRGERADQGSGMRYPLGKVPRSLPSLSRAQALIRRAERAGMTITSRDEALAALRGATADVPGELERALVAICWLAEKAGVEAEQLLREQADQIEARARSELGNGKTNGSNQVPE